MCKFTAGKNLQKTQKDLQKYITDLKPSVCHTEGLSLSVRVMNSLLQALLLNFKIKK